VRDFDGLNSIGALDPRDIRPEHENKQTVVS
jgi:hypothetical protein